MRRDGITVIEPDYKKSNTIHTAQYQDQRDTDTTEDPVTYEGQRFEEEVNSFDYSRKAQKTIRNWRTSAVEASELLKECRLLKKIFFFVYIKKKYK